MASSSVAAWRRAHSRSLGLHSAMMGSDDESTAGANRSPTDDPAERSFKNEARLST
jgi:hypothetical protein